MNAKKWYQSKTIWSAILKAIAGILTSVVLVLDGKVQITDILPGVVTTVWSTIDIMIRFKTNQPIE
jgi:uncharacterized membrane protein